MSDKGHIELDRHIDSIVVGKRHRQDPGDIAALMRSIEEVGLLQPITITPDGVLVCGWRRLEAVRRLGWRTLRVWVRSGISDRLSGLLAQQDENAQRKPLSPLEATELYLELKALQAEDAARRQEATQFGADPAAEPAMGTTGGLAAGLAGASVGEVNGAGHCPAPGQVPKLPRGEGDSRAQAARLITGDQSYHRFERIAWLERVAADTSKPAQVRELADQELRDIENGAPVMPGYSRVKAALEVAATEPDDSEDLGALAEAALARVRQGQSRSGLRGLERTKSTTPKHRTLRSFLLTWAELDGWTRHYEIDDLAASLKEEDVQRFERVVAETVAFAEQLRTARNQAPQIEAAQTPAAAGNQAASA